MIIIAKKKKQYVEIEGKRYEVNPNVKKKVSESIKRLKNAGRLMEIPSLKQKILSGKKITKAQAIKEIEKEIDKTTHRLKKAEEKERKYKNTLRSLKR